MALRDMRSSEVLQTLYFVANAVAAALTNIPEYPGNVRGTTKSRYGPLPSSSAPKLRQIRHISPEKWPFFRPVVSAEDTRGQHSDGLSSVSRADVPERQRQDGRTAAWLSSLLKPAGGDRAGGLKIHASEVNGPVARQRG